MVVTWTVAEQNALADVLTPGHPRSQWYRYTHRFEDRYLPQIRDDAPARKAQRLASYFPTKIGDKIGSLHEVRAAPEPGRHHDRRRARRRYR